MYKSYSYSNMPRPIEPPTAPAPAPPPKPVSRKPPPPPSPTPPRFPLSLGRLHGDDIILLAVIALLLLNDCDDKILLIALAYVFFSDYFGN